MKGVEWKADPLFVFRAEFENIAASPTWLDLVRSTQHLRAGMDTYLTFIGHLACCEGNCPAGTQSEGLYVYVYT